jgi:hypothetical protein
MEKNYAVVKNGIVDNILVFDEPTQELLNHFKEYHEADAIVDSNDDLNCVIEATWDGVKFTKKQPFPSWQLDEETNTWFPPVPYPGASYLEGPLYDWDEETQEWFEVIE